MLVFLANHCPVVQACDDRIIDFVNDYKDKPVKLVAVSVNDIDQDRLPGIKAAHEGQEAQLHIRVR